MPVCCSPEGPGCGEGGGTGASWFLFGVIYEPGLIPGYAQWPWNCPGCGLNSGVPGEFDGSTWLAASSLISGSSSAAALALASASIFLFWAAVGFLPTLGVSALSFGSNTAFFFTTFDSLSSDLALLLAPEVVGMIAQVSFRQ